MNHTSFNTTFSNCGFSLSPVNPANISSDVRAVFIARIVMNTFTCPFIIVLNVLVMAAVKTKPQVRTKSNITLASLATTDLVVGLVPQPLQIANDISLLRGDNMFCATTNLLSNTVTFICLLASVHHLVLMSAERYVAIKHPFAYENHVTEFRITMASLLVWTATIILSSEGFPPTAIVIIFETVMVILPIYFTVSVYKEVRRNKKQIAANQVSLEAKEKLLKKSKAFYTTVIVLLAILLCYFPSNICTVILLSFKEKIPPNTKVTVLFVCTFLPVLNSLINPLIYAVRIRYFRVAFIQLLSRKTISQAEELEKRIFGSRPIGVNSDGNTGQGNHKLND